MNSLNFQPAARQPNLNACWPTLKLNICILSASLFPSSRAASPPPLSTATCARSATTVITFFLFFFPPCFWQDKRLQSGEVRYFGAQHLSKVSRAVSVFLFSSLRSLNFHYFLFLFLFYLLALVLDCFSITPSMGASTQVRLGERSQKEILRDTRHHSHQAPLSPEPKSCSSRYNNLSITIPLWQTRAESTPHSCVSLCYYGSWKQTKGCPANGGSTYIKRQQITAHVMGPFPAKKLVDRMLVK